MWYDELDSVAVAPGIALSRGGAVLVASPTPARGSTLDAAAAAVAVAAVDPDDTDVVSLRESTS
jgi:hypothetical protein